MYSVISERIDRKTLLLVNVACHAVEKTYFYSISKAQVQFNSVIGALINSIQGYFYNVFDLRLIWAASLFNFVGGGHVVFNTLTLAMIAENVSASSLSVSCSFLSISCDLRTDTGIGRMYSSI